MPFPVKTTGLLIWKLAAVATTEPNEFVSHTSGFGVHQRYVPVERDPERLEKLLTEFINLLESEMPEAGTDCHTCNYVLQRAELGL
jgi:hypothetical protein